MHILFHIVCCCKYPSDEYYSTAPGIPTVTRSNSLAVKPIEGQCVTSVAKVVSSLQTSEALQTDDVDVGQEKNNSDHIIGGNDEKRGNRRATLCISSQVFLSILPKYMFPNGSKVNLMCSLS